MPYYIYRVLPYAHLQRLAEFASYKAASTHAKALRALEGSAPRAKIKVMFADSERLAEDLLCQVRDPGPPGDD